MGISQERCGKNLGFEVIFRKNWDFDEENGGEVWYNKRGKVSIFLIYWEDRRYSCLIHGFVLRFLSLKPFPQVASLEPVVTGLGRSFARYAVCLCRSEDRASTSSFAILDSSAVASESPSKRVYKKRKLINCIFKCEDGR